jgi:glycine cleavage system H protein
MTALFVVGMILVCLTIDFIYQNVRARQVGPEAVAAPVPAFSKLVPSPGSFLGRGHTWARLSDDGRVRLGLDQLVRHAIGTPDRVELPESGTRVKKGEVLLTAFRGERKVAVKSPLSGIVAAVNPSKGGLRTGEWLVCVEPSRLGAELKLLLVGEEAVAWIRKEATRFREFLVDGFATAPVPVTLPDGGEPAEGVLNLLGDEQWAEFQEEFLAEDD